MSHVSQPISLPDHDMVVNWLTETLGKEHLHWWRGEIDRVFGNSIEFARVFHLDVPDGKNEIITHFLLAFT